MYCHHGIALKSPGGGTLTGYFVECLSGETVVPIYADNAGSPIASLSGVTDRAKTDARGNFFFYVTDGTYNLKYYDDNGVYQFTETGFTMDGGGLALREDLADSSGAALIGTGSGGTVQSELNARPTSAVLADDTGAALVGTTGIGNVQSDLNARPTSTTLADGDGSSLVGFIQSGTGAVTTTVQAKLREGAVSAADFSTVAQAVATGKDVFFPAGTWSFDQVVVTTPGQRFYGVGPAAIIRASDATKDLFLVRASDVEFIDLRMQGASTSAVNGTFAIKTDAAYPAPRLRVERVQFTGEDATKGFNNAVKFDTGADNGSVTKCYIERLWGTASGYGYGVLCGDVDGVIVAGCSGVGTAGRGRHFVYLSAGASDCKVFANPSIVGFESSAITIYATDVQPACDGNIIAFNTLTNCVTSNSFAASAIDMFLNVTNTLVFGNIINGSGGCGIRAEGTGSTKLKNNNIIGNTINNSRYIGIEVVSLIGGSICNNTINESGLAAAATYSNIRLISDGATATSDILVTGNRSFGLTYSRSPFQLNSYAPAPTSLKVYGNKFSVCNLTDVELNGVTCAIDGRIRFTQAGVTYGPIANGAALSTAYAIPGVDQGDVVTVSHTSDCNGCSVTAYSNGTNAVTVTVLNNSGGSKTISSGTLRIDVWKREP